MGRVELAEPYRPRAVRFLRIAEPEGWRLKVYGIAYGSDRPGEVLIEAALATAPAVLPAPGYGIGFLGIHQGRTENFVFLDWWAKENELHHRVWFSPSGDPAALRAARDGDPIACAWDLSVIGFERAAWVEHVLSNPAGPDPEGYLAARLEGEV